MKPLLVVNPSSSGGRTGRILEELLVPLRRRLGEVDVRPTERPRHAADIAEEAAREGRTLVVALGGDGTVSEVVCGLARAKEAGADALPKLGIVGLGTGGDFRKTLGLEHRLDRYAEVIAAGKTRRIDVGRFSYVGNDGAPANAHFVNILSMGIGGLVDRHVATGSRALGGTVAYLVASVRGLIESEIGHLVLRGEGEGIPERLSTRQVAICNGRYFGSGMQVAPMADPSDGWFDVVSLGDAPRAKFLLSSSAMYSGSHVGKPGVVCFRARSIEIDLENEPARERYLLDVDGEALGRLPIRVELVPGLIEVCAP